MIAIAILQSPIATSSSLVELGAQGGHIVVRDKGLLARQNYHFFFELALYAG